MRRDSTALPAASVSRILAAALGISLLAWTSASAVVPSLRPTIRAPGVRAPIQMAGVLVACLMSGLAFLRYSLTRTRSALLLSLAFMVTAATEAVVGFILLPSHLAITPARTLYLWIPGTLMAAGLFAASGLRNGIDPRPGVPQLDLVLRAAAVFALLGFAEGLVLGLRFDLPSLARDPGGAPLTSFPTSFVPRLTWIDLAVGSAAALLSVGAAVGFLRRSERPGPRSTWLGFALLFAAFADLHWMLTPIIPPDRLTTGDVLRYLFWLAALAALVEEIRVIYSSESSQASQLVAAYQSERLRVRDLERLERERAELTRIVTHDITHAIAALRSYAVTLSRRWDALDDQLRLEVVQWIERETGRLRDLSEQAVSAMTLDTDSLPLVRQPERSGELVREAADAVDHLGGRLHVRVEAGSEMATVMVDRGRFLQVLRNLLQNAERYSSPGTPVELQAAHADGEVVFIVRNEGPEIPARDMSRLFRPFSRLDGSSGKEEEGSGLGLYISRRIVDAHGGRIWAESIARQTSFYVALPLSGEAP